MIRLLIKFYILILIADAILSYFPQWKRKVFGQQINKLAEYSLSPVRRLIGDHTLPIDPSPIVVIVGLQLLMLLW